MHFTIDDSPLSEAIGTGRLINKELYVNGQIGNFDFNWREPSGEFLHGSSISMASDRGDRHALLGMVMVINRLPEEMLLTPVFEFGVWTWVLAVSSDWAHLTQKAERPLKAEDTRFNIEARFRFTHVSPNGLKVFQTLKLPELILDS